MLAFLETAAPTGIARKTSATAAQVVRSVSFPPSPGARLLSLARAVALGVAIGLTGCGAHFDGRLYRNSELAFELRTIPSSWRRLDTDQVLLAFRDDQHRVTVMVNGRCGKDGDDVPLEALTHHLFLYFTDRQVISQQRWMLDGREALRTVELARLDGVPRRFVSVVLKKNGCVYDFVHISGPEQDEQSEAAFDRFVRGFHTVRP